MNEIKIKTKDRFILLAKNSNAAHDSNTGKVEINNGLNIKYILSDDDVIKPH